MSELKRKQIIQRLCREYDLTRKARERDEIIAEIAIVRAMPADSNWHFNKRGFVMRILILSIAAALIIGGFIVARLFSPYGIFLNFIGGLLVGWGICGNFAKQNGKRQP